MSVALTRDMGKQTEAFKDYFTHRDDEEFLRDMLVNREKYQNESVIEYILAKNCVCHRTDSRIVEEEKMGQRK